MQVAVSCRLLACSGSLLKVFLLSKWLLHFAFDIYISQLCQGTSYNFTGLTAFSSTSRFSINCGFYWNASVCAKLVVSDSLQRCGLQPVRLLCPWDFSGKNTGVSCISYSRGSSWPRDPTCISSVSCISRLVLYC